MKKIFFSVVMALTVVMVFSGCESLNLSDNPTMLGNRIYETYDVINDVNFIDYKIQYDVPVRVYIGTHKGQNKWLRAVFEYNGDEWVFFNKAYIYDDMGDKIEFHFNYFDIDHKVEYGRVKEKIDVEFPSDQLPMFEKILNNGLKVRFVGKNRANTRSMAGYKYGTYWQQEIINRYKDMTEKEE